MRRDLRAVTDVVLLCTCVVVLAELAWRYHRPFLNLFGRPVAAEHRASPTKPKGASVGSESRASSKESGLNPQRISWLPETGYQLADRTVALVLSKGCRFCDASMPFYRKLNEAQRRRPFRLVAVTPDSIEAFGSYLREQLVSVDSIVGVVASRLQVSGTPTLVLIDRAGTIRELWTGQLPEAEQLKVLRALSVGGP